MRTHRLIMAVIATVIMSTGGLAGCATEPWVKPYEREYLADPLMSPSRDPLSDKHRQHVFDTREASRGAVTTAGGGCGCN